jgi:hypothetical protein
MRGKNRPSGSSTGDYSGPKFSSNQYFVSSIKEQYQTPLHFNLQTNISSHAVLFGPSTVEGFSLIEQIIVSVVLSGKSPYCLNALYCHGWAKWGAEDAYRCMVGLKPLRSSMS